MKQPQPKLSPKVEKALAQAKRESKKLNKLFVARLRIALAKKFARTDAKSR